MKRITYSLFVALLAICGVISSCSEFNPEGMPDVPTLAKASDLTAIVEGHNIKLTWVNPSSADIENILLIHNGNGANPTVLPSNSTSYTVVGQPMGKCRAP